MADKYAPLAAHLRALAAGGDVRAEFTFGAIDRLVGGLSDSARRHRPWWGNGGHPQATAWLGAGWHVQAVDLPGARVTFEIGPSERVVTRDGTAGKPARMSAGPLAAQPTVAVLCEALDAYRSARQELLRVLGLDVSNRDPLPEWSEHLVAVLTGGQLAPSRVQEGYDLTTPDGDRVQVRCLSNTGPAWVNEHPVRMTVGAHRYALVLFEGFTVIGVLLFPQDLTAVGAALGKKHLEQNVSLQLTAANWRAIRDEPERYRGLGMEVWLPPFVSAGGSRTGEPRAGR